jgi:hypothetical protein
MPERSKIYFRSPSLALIAFIKHQRPSHRKVYSSKWQAKSDTQPGGEEEVVMQQ